MSIVFSEYTFKYFYSLWIVDSIEFCRFCTPVASSEVPVVAILFQVDCMVWGYQLSMPCLRFASLLLHQAFRFVPLNNLNLYIYLVL